jgi:hypothetical protein
MERPSAEIYALVRGSTIYMRFYAALCQGNCRLHRIEKERRSESFGEVGKPNSLRSFEQLVDSLAAIIEHAGIAHRLENASARRSQILLSHRYR